jgi:hypothetical protein
METKPSQKPAIWLYLSKASKSLHGCETDLTWTSFSVMIGLPQEDQLTG